MFLFYNYFILLIRHFQLILKSVFVKRKNLKLDKIATLVLENNYEIKL
jgi:hypothetical protein